jgi:RNA polymerase sigma factor (TIGR02999 family)
LTEPAREAMTVMSHAPEDVTSMLLRWSEGDREALDHLMPFVYDELHRIAERYFHRESPDNTLQPTALVNEFYIRLVNQNQMIWQNRAQFFGIAAQIMRRVLVDRARARKATKRGSGDYKLGLTDISEVPAVGQPLDLLALDQALEGLAAFDPQQGRIVELKFFGGLSIEEIAQVMGLSPATVKREWALAKSWLFRELNK